MQPIRKQKRYLSLYHMITQAKTKLPQKPKTGKDNSVKKQVSPAAKHPPAGKLSPKKKPAVKISDKKIKLKSQTAEASNFSAQISKLSPVHQLLPKQSQRREESKAIGSSEANRIVDSINAQTRTLSLLLTKMDGRLLRIEKSQLAMAKGQKAIEGSLKGMEGSFKGLEVSVKLGALANEELGKLLTKNIKDNDTRWTKIENMLI